MILLLSPPPVEPERLARVRVVARRIDFRCSLDAPLETKGCAAEGCGGTALRKNSLCADHNRARDAANRRAQRARRKGGSNG